MPRAASLALAGALLCAGCGAAVRPADPPPPGTAATPAGPIVTTDPGCPAAAPEVGGVCGATGLQCTYTDSRHHGLAFECYLGRWAQLYTTGGCEARPTFECPGSPGSPPPGLPPVYMSSEAAKVPCGACLYGGAAACGYRPFDRGPYCSGIPPDPTPMDEIYVQWSCGPIGRVACATGPVDGAACAPDGVACGRNCCGPEITCVKGRWRMAPLCPGIP